jgi:predicted cupin superfamily sugar epimerase
VSTGVWQKARSLGDWTLVGCTVAPGFVFEGFEMLEGINPPELAGEGDRAERGGGVAPTGQD